MSFSILVVEFEIKQEKTTQIIVKIKQNEGKHAGVEIYEDELRYARNLIIRELKNDGFICDQDVDEFSSSKKDCTPYLACEKLRNLLSNRQYCNKCDKRTIRITRQRHCNICFHSDKAVMDICDMIVGKHKAVMDICDRIAGKVNNK
jgi:hypothetical protein